MASPQLGAITATDMVVNEGGGRIMPYTIFEVAYQSTYRMEAHGGCSHFNSFLLEVH